MWNRRHKTDEQRERTEDDLLRVRQPKCAVVAVITTDKVDF